MNKASFSFKQGYLNDAKEALDYVLALDSLNYSALVMKSSIAGKLGDNILALRNLNEIISRQDSFPTSAYEERAFVYIKLEKFDSAIIDYEMLLKHSNSFSTYPVLKAYTLNNLGYALYKIGAISKGLDKINESINLEPSNPYAYRNRGEVMILTDNLVEGCIDLKKAKELGFADLYGDEVDNLIKRYCK